MGVGNITSMNSMAGLQTSMAGSTDVKSKNIQNEITDIEQQMQKVSSQEELSADEKADERKKLQKEISSLNTELERHQEEFLRSQKREVMMAKLQEDEKPTEEWKAVGRMQTDTDDQEGAAEKDEKITDSDTTALIHNGVSAAEAKDVSTQQSDYQGTVIARNRDGVVILTGELSSDEKRGVGTDESNEEDLAAEETDDKEAAAETGMSHKEMNAMVSADASAQQASRQGTVIARISGGIAVLKGEMNLDELRGENTDRKQEQLEKLEEREEKARIFQFSVLGEANGAVQSAATAEVSGLQADTENNALINATNLSQEEAQQRFFVSFG